MQASGPSLVCYFYLDFLTCQMHSWACCAKQRLPIKGDMLSYLSVAHLGWRIQSVRIGYETKSYNLQCAFHFIANRGTFSTLPSIWQGVQMGVHDPWNLYWNSVEDNSKKASNVFPTEINWINIRQKWMGVMTKVMGEILQRSSGTVFFTSLLSHSKFLLILEILSEGYLIFVTVVDDTLFVCHWWGGKWKNILIWMGKIWQEAIETGPS